MEHHKNSIISKKIYKGIIPLAVCLFCLCPPLLQSQTTPLPEYKIKAVFLFNFTQFVEWPDNAFNSTTDPFVIGIVGKDPFGKYIDEAVAGEKMGDHPITIVRYRNTNEVGNCQVLFISAEEDESISAILSSLNQHAMLTVSDAPAFTQYGGMIGFITAKSKIRLQININAAKTAGLNISSKLLNVAGTSQ
jgi:hypothetical protein